MWKPYKHIWHQPYPKGTNGVRALGACPPHLLLDPAHEVPEWFGAGDDVERSWQSTPFFKITHPQFCPCKFPLNVCMVLKSDWGIVDKNECFGWTVTLTWLFAVFLISAHSNVLVGVVHHSYEHVEEDHQWNDVVGPEHVGTDKFSELVVSIHIGHIQADQTKDRPEKRLQGLK